MNRKHIHIAILALSALLLLSNCSKKVKIGFLMDISEQERWIKDKNLFVNNVHKLGGEVIVKASEGNAEVQFTMAGELLDEGVDILVVIPSDMFAAADIVKLAHKHEVPVISYDRIIKNCNLDFYISFDIHCICMILNINLSVSIL